MIKSNNNKDYWQQKQYQETSQMKLLFIDLIDQLPADQMLLGYALISVSISPDISTNRDGASRSPVSFQDHI